MRIYLIGFMGSGKSTLGHKVAQAFDVPFMDTDQMIEESAGMSVAEIFEKKGEPYFRQLEGEALRQTFSYPKAIMATGGGLPAFQHNMDWILTHGISIYLEWPLDKLKSRLIREGIPRPMLKDFKGAELENQIENLFLTRKLFYEQAAITIEMSGDEETDYLTLEKACRYIW